MFRARIAKVSPHPPAAKRVEVARNERTSVGRARARLLEWVDGGNVADGELLPSERQLAAVLQLDRGTLRRAIKEATAHGHLVREGRRLLRCERAAAAPVDRWLAKAIVVVVPQLDLANAAVRPWLRYVTLGATEAVRAARLHAVTLNSDALGDDEIAPLLTSPPRGVLLPELFGNAELVQRVANRFAEANVPVVVYGDDPQFAHLDRVVSDHEAGSYQLTRALLEAGRRPARFWRGPWNTWWLGRRSSGYVRAMTEAGLPPLPMIEFPLIDAHARTAEDFGRLSRQVVGFLVDALRGSERIDALMVVSDRDAFYAAEAVRILGLEPGRDVVIAGYDNSWSLCAETMFTTSRPSLSVEKHNEKMGEAMLELLLSRTIAAAPPRPTVQKIVPELKRLD